jgi:hypothetical protein
VLEVKTGDQTERMMTLVDVLDQWTEKKPSKKKESDTEKKKAAKNYEQQKML